MTCDLKLDVFKEASSISTLFAGAPSPDLQQSGVGVIAMPSATVTNLVLKPRGPRCPGIVSDSLREYSSLFNKNGAAPSRCKLAVETSIGEGGVFVIRNKLCPWSRVNVEATNCLAAVDPLRYQKFLLEAFTLDFRLSSQSRRSGCCKYCAILEKNLLRRLIRKRKAQEVPVKEIMPNVEFRPLLENDEISPIDREKSKQKQEHWEKEKKQLLVKISELTNRASRAEKRVVELEKLMRDRDAAMLDDSYFESEALSFPSSSNDAEEQGRFSCKSTGCSKTFKSNKTLQRHIMQKHANNVKLLICNQPTVNGMPCSFQTVHSGVLSYHQKHSLSHQRKDDWHILCPHCNTKFARLHEMERHERICKARPKTLQ